MTGIEATYKLLIDFDQDGFFNEGVLSTDPLNLIVGARQTSLRWADGFPYEGFSADRVFGEHAYGVWTHTAMQLSTAPNAGIALNSLVFGRGRLDPAPPGAVAGIPLAQGTQYTVKFQVKVNSGSTSVTLTAYNQDDTAQGSATVVQTTGVWTDRTLTFTADASMVNAFFLIYQPATAGDQSLSVRGMMLVPGASVPTAWNAGSPSNVYDDITAYMESAKWSYGIPIYSDAISQPAQLAIVLNNLSGDWTPENSASPFYPLNKGNLLRMVATYGGVDRTLYQGISTTLRVDVGLRNTQRAILMAGDPLDKLYNSEYLAPLQLNARTDEILSTMFDAGAILYPYPGHFWLVGVEGASEMSTTTVLYANRITDFEQGDSTFTFAGDITDSNQPVTAGRVAREYMYAELGGRLWWDVPTLKFIFTRRSHDSRAFPTLVNVSDMELDEPPEYAWGDDLLNHFTLSFFPRKVGASNTLLYTMNNVPMSLASEASRTIRVRFSTPDAPDASTAALLSTRPVATTDYLANAQADGLGADKTSVLIVDYRPSATGADLVITNRDVVTVYVTFFQIRGTPLTTYTRDSVVEQDGVSIIHHGEYRRTLDLPALDSIDLATQYANYLVQRYKNPQGRIASFTLWANRSATHMGIVLDTQIGDGFTVADAIVENAVTDYVVTAQAHSLDAKRTHLVRYTVEPLNRATLWILDDAEFSLLEDTTRLGL